MPIPVPEQNLGETQASPHFLLLLAFLLLGLLIGTLLAFSTQSIVQGVVAGVFAFFGGSILAVINTRSRNSQVATAAGTIGLSIGALLGVYSGLFVNEHQLLSPQEVRLARPQSQPHAATPTKYLRENLLQSSSEIDQKLRTRQITIEEAYERQYQLNNK